jgi:hypothetical protein
MNNTWSKYPFLGCEKAKKSVEGYHVRVENGKSYPKKCDFSKKVVFFRIFFASNP